MRELVVVLVLLGAVTVAAGCPDADRQGLTQLFDKAGGAGWLDAAGWREAGADCCQWAGVTCTAGGDVVEVSLPSNNLVGRLPPWDGTVLQSLRVLRLSNNTLGGSLAPLGDFINSSSQGVLSDIDLAHNRLEGPVPGTLFRQELRRLDLRGNNLSGNIDSDTVGRASALQDIDLRGNQLLEGSPHGTQAEYALTHANKCLLGCTAMRCPAQSTMVQQGCQLCAAPPRDRVLFRTPGTVVIDTKMLGDCGEFAEAPPAWYMPPLVNSNITQYRHWPTQFRINSHVLRNEPWVHRQFIPGPQGHGHLAISSLDPGGAYEVVLPGAAPISLDGTDGGTAMKKEWEGMGPAVSVRNMIDDYCDFIIDPKTMIRYRDARRTKLCVDRAPQEGHASLGPFGQHKMIEIKSIEDPIRNPLRDETLIEAQTAGFKEGESYSIMVCGEDDEGVFPMSDAVRIVFEPRRSRPLGASIFLWASAGGLAVFVAIAAVIMVLITRARPAPREAASGYLELGGEEGGPNASPDEPAEGVE